MDNKIVEFIIGAVLPPVIDLLNNKIPNGKVRYLVSVAVCLVIGAVVNLKQLTAGDILASAAIVFAAAQTTYKTYWEKSDARKVLKATVN